MININDNLVRGQQILWRNKNGKLIPVMFRYREFNEKKQEEMFTFMFYSHSKSCRWYMYKSYAHKFELKCLDNGK